MTERKPTRVNRKSSSLNKAAHKAVEPAPVEVKAPVETAATRPPMRPEMRAEDPRERAKRRVEELRGKGGYINENVDEFEIDPSMVPDGWTYEWKTAEVVGMEMPGHLRAMRQSGWEPVPASRHPDQMPTGTAGHAAIERKGMVLMERPKEITDEVKAHELRNAKMQVRQKEQQLKEAPDGTFERSNKENSLVKVKRSYEAMPIPE